MNDTNNNMIKASAYNRKGMQKRIGLILLFVCIATIMIAGCTSQPAPASVAAPVATPAEITTAATPVLIGIWTGTTFGHSKAEGFREPTSLVFNISEQKGQAFAGTKEFTRPDGKFYAEKFSGVISRTGDISFADHDRNGISLGKLTGPDAMEIRYIEDGVDAKAMIDLLNRQKS
jgi:hypothetical protein